PGDVTSISSSKSEVDHEGNSEPESNPELAPDTLCRKCGRQFRPEEFFCGSCGMARFAEEASGGSLQSKWASLWYLQQAAERRQQGDTEKESAFVGTRMTDSNTPLPAALQEVVAQFSDQEDSPGNSDAPLTIALKTENAAKSETQKEDLLLTQPGEKAAAVAAD